MIWAKEETLSRDEMSALQLSRLKETVKRVYEKPTWSFNIFFHQRN